MKYQKLLFIASAVLLFFSPDLARAETTPLLQQEWPAYLNYLLPVVFFFIFIGFGLLPLMIDRLTPQILILVGIASVILTGFFLFMVDVSLMISVYKEYISFISILLVYYIISASIEFHIRYHGSPEYNTAYLLMASLSANILGAIGATIILIRPFLKANQHRRYTMHLPVFFIIIVTNLGGILSPLGQLHLYLVYLRGFPVELFIDLLPIWLIAITGSLVIFYVIDRITIMEESVKNDPRIELSNDIHRAIQTQKVPQSLLLKVQDYLESPIIKLRGGWNLMIIGAIFAIIFYAQKFHDPFPFRELGILFLAILVYYARHGVDDERERAIELLQLLKTSIYYIFTFVIFVPLTVIFLRLMGHTSEFISISLYAWAGLLSAVMDNVPVNILLSNPGFITGNYQSALPMNGPSILRSFVENPEYLRRIIAIITASTLLGGATLTGNIFNIHVRSWTREYGMRFPGFFRYFKYSLPVQLTVFLLVGLLFFWLA